MIDDRRSDAGLLLLSGDLCPVFGLPFLVFMCTHPASMLFILQALLLFSAAQQGRASLGSDTSGAFVVQEAREEQRRIYMLALLSR